MMGSSFTTLIVILLAILAGVLFLAGAWTGWKIRGVFSFTPPPDQSLEAYYQDTTRGLAQLQSQFGSEAAVVREASANCARLREQLEAAYRLEHMDAGAIAARIAQLSV